MAYNKLRIVLSYNKHDKRQVAWAKDMTEVLKEDFESYKAVAAVLYKTEPAEAVLANLVDMINEDFTELSEQVRREFAQAAELQKQRWRKLDASLNSETLYAALDFMTFEEFERYNQ